MRRTLRAGPVEIPIDEVELRASRSSGPGGQHANVTASRIDASFAVASSRALSDAQKRRLEARYGERVTAAAQDSRSQARNRDLALDRLAQRVAAGLRTRRRRRATKPSRAARERRLEAKRRRSQAKRLRRPPELD